jgi:hypothetical protein
MIRPDRFTYWTIVAVGLMVLIPVQGVHGQDAHSQGQFGIGAQVGKPTGFTTKYYARKEVALVLLASWNLDRFLLFSSHIIYEHPIPDSPLLFFLGPGFFLGNRSDRDRHSVELGAGVTAGLNFFVEHFEVYLQTTPDLELWPDRRVYLGGAVGIRYFF